MDKLGDFGQKIIKWGAHNKRDLVYKNRIFVIYPPTTIRHGRALTRTGAFPFFSLIIHGEHIDVSVILITNKLKSSPEKTDKPSWRNIINNEDRCIMNE